MKKETILMSQSMKNHATKWARRHNNICYGQLYLNGLNLNYVSATKARNYN